MKKKKTQHNMRRTSLCAKKQTNFVILLYRLSFNLCKFEGVIFHLWTKFKVHLLVDALNSVIYYTIYFSSYLNNVSSVYIPVLWRISRTKSPMVAKPYIRLSFKCNYTRLVTYFQNKICNGG